MSLHGNKTATLHDIYSQLRFGQRREGRSAELLVVRQGCHKMDYSLRPQPVLQWCRTAAVSQSPSGEILHTVRQRCQAKQTKTKTDEDAALPVRGFVGCTNVTEEVTEDQEWNTDVSLFQSAVQ